MEKLKILLVDDQLMFAESLRTFLNNYANDMDVVSIAEDGIRACELVRTVVPDIILMDVRMPGMDGVEAVRKIKPEFPSVKIIMLSTYDEDEFVREALLAGASGYLLKDISPTELIVSIRALNSGVMQISPSIARRLVQKTYVENKPIVEGNSPAKAFPWLDTLTQREREIFALLATGKDNDQIAQQLGLALQTVRNQVSTVYSKLDVKDRFEIIQLANKTE